MTNGSTMLSSKWIQIRMPSGPWKQEINYHLPTVLSAFQAGILSYPLCRWSPTMLDTKWVSFDWMGELNRFVYWACKICIKQIGGLLFGRPFSALLSWLPMVRPKMFVLWRLKSFLHLQTRSNGTEAALCRSSNPSALECSFVLGREVFSLGCDHRTVEKGFHFITLYFLFKLKKNKVWLTCSSRYFVFRTYLSFLWTSLATIIK